MTAEPAPRTWPGPVDEGLRDGVARLLETADDGALPIVQAGHPVLRRPAHPYTGQLGDVLGPLLESMRRTMLAAPGVGLAAPQIGVPLRLAVLHDPGFPAGYEDAAVERERAPLPHRTIVNPRYEEVPTPSSGQGVERRSFYEGCLSVAGYQAVVARFRSVRLTAQDETGGEVDEVLTGWSARIVQHETDHLEGVLYVDRAQMRSLAANDDFARAWGGATTAQIGEVLGFRVEG
jgi:peptide deformylase